MVSTSCITNNNKRTTSFFLMAMEGYNLFISRYSYNYWLRDTPIGIAVCYYEPRNMKRIKECLSDHLEFGRRWYEVTDSLISNDERYDFKQFSEKTTNERCRIPIEDSYLDLCYDPTIITVRDPHVVEANRKERVRDRQRWDQVMRSESCRHTLSEESPFTAHTLPTSTPMPCKRTKTMKSHRSNCQKRQLYGQTMRK